MKVCGQKLVKFCAHTHTRGSISSKDVMITVQGRGVASCVSNEVCPVFIDPYRGFHCGCRRVF